MARKEERIDSIVKSYMEKLQRDSNMTDEEISNAWKDVAGVRAFCHTRPVSLRKKRLVIHVDGSTWLYELSMRKEGLLRKLKQRLGDDKIKQIQFRIGET